MKYHAFNMDSAANEVETSALVLRLSPVIDMTDDQFLQLCSINGDLRIERTASGDLVIMPPAGGSTSHRNATICFQLQAWAKVDGRGIVFDSTGGFRLPNGAIRAPDASWVERSRLARLTGEEKDKFLPLCPDFVIELRSPSDAIRDVRAKMDEYMTNGARLGWLIDPLDRRVFVYRPDALPAELENPATLSGEPVLAGFVLDFGEIWEPKL